jgi:phosphoenolpyruvate synthase/pyruvate phosphate dikinase
MKYVRLFKDIVEADRSSFGGKVTNLGLMLQAGIRVPNGFGISIEAHREFMDKPFSKQFLDEIDKAFSVIGSERVSVRSSAIAEDSADASWAGQFESYLNVLGKDLETSIRKCWQSARAEHVQHYASDKQLAEDGLLVGVGIQAMIDSEFSGVMFTNDPVTKDPSVLVIESAYGLGEVVVQGTVTPDNYVVHRGTMHVDQFDIGIKQKMMIFKDGANVLIDVPADKADRATLRESQVLELAKQGVSVEQYFGAAQDIEWAIAEDIIYILQARPITA